MKFIETPLKGSFVIEIEPLQDERGIFSRTFCREEFAQIGFYKQIVQINHSITRQQGAIRGMHYQCLPACEAKIIRCVGGRVFDVMVDIRVNSSTFMQWYGVDLSEENMQMVYIPEGFAHGFQALTDNAQLIYHHSELYNPEHERGLRFNDPALAIEWPLAAGTISSKDQNYPLIDGSFRGIQI
ncbi:MAG: dTDP-4-dehydrorhamnose 3,5-epimerase [Chloroflexota bacterium]